MARVRLTPEAEADIRRGYRWYRDTQPGLGDSFLDEVEAALTRVRKNPHGYSIAHEQIRRILLRRFPYALFYFLDEGDSAVVIGCFHGRRDPTSWQKRNKT